jgi:hypothetical protein
MPAILVEWGWVQFAGLVVGAAGRCGREGGCAREAARNDMLVRADQTQRPGASDASDSAPRRIRRCRGAKESVCPLQLRGGGQEQNISHLFTILVPRFQWSDWQKIRF